MATTGTLGVRDVCEARGKSTMQGTFAASKAAPYPDYPASREWSEGFQQQFEDARVEGWSVDEAFRDRVILVQRDFGNAVAHIFLFLFTLGLGNIIYAYYRYQAHGRRKVIRDEYAGAGSETETEAQR